jgi:hypothetical protein
LVAVSAIVCIVGCEKADQAHADKEELAKAHKEIEELSTQLDLLVGEIKELKVKNEQLESHQKRLQPRIQRLISGYGTGIWDHEENDIYPVFARSMKGADVKAVIAGLNERFLKYKQPQVGYKKTEERTVFIGLDNEEQLGERMGSHGALNYMTSVSYSLTSVKGVDCVYFDIKEGEHAGPGKYCINSNEFLFPH